MAKISTIKNCIWLARAAGFTPFIWGHRGLGKSSLVRQLCASAEMGFIDFRCSQVEASDIRGLPDRGADNRTHYLPPADMPVGDLSNNEILRELAAVLEIDHEDDDASTPQKVAEALAGMTDVNTERKYYLKLQQLQPRYQRGIVFLDEINRAQDDVLQAVFELVLENRVGQYVIPPGWSIVCAGNYMEGYQVSGFNDPAFLDRFCHLNLSGGESTLEEWVDYMSQTFGEYASDVVEYASQNIMHLDGDIPGERGFSVQPSRRSWEMVARLQKAHRTGGENNKATSDSVAYFECLAGLIGFDLAAAFNRHSCPVKPRELISNGVKAYHEVLLKLSRNELTGVMWGLVSFCKERINEDKIAEVCMDFAEFMAKNADDKDVVVAFCRALVTDQSVDDNIAAAVISNPRLAEAMRRFNKASGNSSPTKTFIDRLNERPDLQQILSRVAWGSDEEED
jgi:hypothetical protein